MTPSRRFDVILFDLDGTLLDTKDAIDASLEFACTFAGLDYHSDAVQELYFQVMSAGASLGEASKQLWGNLNVPADVDPHSIVDAYRDHYDKVSSDLTRPFPNLTHTLTQLAEWKIPLGVVTNKGEQSATTALEGAGILDFFELLICDKPGIIPKPNPDSYHRIIAPHFSLEKPSNVLMIGDTATDITYTQAFHGVACWARYGYGDPQKIPLLEPDFIIDSPHELLAIINN